MIFRTLLLVSLLLEANISNAWLYPEHRDITLLAIRKLSPEYRAELDKLWVSARMTYAQRLTLSVIDPEQGRKPAQLDFAAWPGISADHSTSPANLLHNVLETEWILKVADIAAQLKIDIASSKNNGQHVNAIRNSDIRFQWADREYATRAGSNNVHFLLARPDVDTDAREYFSACVAKGTELNALGAYSWFHVSALKKAVRYASENLTEEDRSSLTLAILADEAFAIHFLEDVFASGHTAGTWGSASVRKGTHDYYNEKGLEVVTWDNQKMIIMGDAYMRPQDAEVASVSVRLSLEQILNAASGKLKIDYLDDRRSLENHADTFNVCRNNYMPYSITEKGLMAETVVKTPVPGLATGLGELPRFRSEIGMFVGASSSLNGGIVFGGFGERQTNTGTNAGVEVNARFGLGLDGVLNQAGDGLVFVQAGWKQDGASSNQFTVVDEAFSPSSLTSAIPARSAYNFRIRMPFWLIPGDLLIGVPLMMLIAPKEAAKMAVVAGNGGLIPWQSGISTRVGRFQFVLGREIGVSFYGRKKINDMLFVPVSDTKTTLISYRSTQFDFPFLEYSPFKSFSTDQSSGLIIQLSCGIDVPQCNSVSLPVGAPIPALKSVWYLGTHIVFNWRKYL